MTQKKYCNGCGKLRPVDQWARNRSTRDGFGTQCKSCQKNRAAKHYKLNKEKVLLRLRKYNSSRGKYLSLEKKYGLTKQQFEQMITDSKGICNICKSIFKKKEPYVDHCHDTKKVRGLLCNDCNVGLSRFKDNETFLLNAVKYLKQ